MIGGASLFGAKGGAFGAAAGALIVGTLNNGGNLLAINSFYLQIIIGALIHTIALNAAFLAAQAGTAVSMALVLEAARCEFRKLERPLNETDFRL